ncbi:hypothetical protein Dimus_031687, partial [Dionaea muscipula]
LPATACARSCPRAIASLLYCACICYLNDTSPHHTLPRVARCSATVTRIDDDIAAARSIGENIQGLIGRMLEDTRSLTTNSSDLPSTTYSSLRKGSNAVAPSRASALHLLHRVAIDAAAHLLQ